MLEIVGAKINGNIITNVFSEIVAAAKRGADIEPLSRPHMKMMSSFDLGGNWDNMANGETLFLQKEDGSFEFN